MKAHQRKSFAAIEFKDGAPEGTFRATIARFGSEPDKDGDVYSGPQAFPRGKAVVISAYMHTSWQGALPVGKGVVGADEQSAYVDGQFFTNTTNGKDTYLTVKALAESGQGEWSYGYDVLDGSVDPKELQAFPGAARILKSLDIFEASPVLIGAGIGTSTESIKSAVRARKIAERAKQMTADPNTLATIAQIDLLADALDELVDTLMDEFDIPDPDEIAEGEPEEGGAGSQAADDIVGGTNGGNMAAGSDMPKGMRLIAATKDAPDRVRRLVDRYKALAAYRAKEGRVLSAANRDRLSTLLDALTSASADITGLLDATAPADAGKAIDASDLWLQFEATRSQNASRLTA